MAFASLNIGDSQTMAAEAGVLGVPFVWYKMLDIMELIEVPRIIPDRV